VLDNLRARTGLPVAGKRVAGASGA
jgi:hypothetical protein